MHASHTGIAGGRSIHPCCFCEVTINKETPLATQLSAGRLRSCISNRRHFKKYRSSKDKIQKNHKNCISDPIRHFPQSTDIISFIRIPQVHSYLHLNYYIKNIKKLAPIIETWYVCRMTFVVIFVCTTACYFFKCYVTRDASRLPYRSS